MKKTLTIPCSYVVGRQGAGIFAARYSLGPVNLNEQTALFSDKEAGISVRFFAINHGVCIHGSINGAPIEEASLQTVAERLIVICCGNESLISWRKQDDFHLAGCSAPPQRNQPLFGLLPMRKVGVPPPRCVTYAEALSGSAPSYEC